MRGEHCGGGHADCIRWCQLPVPTDPCWLLILSATALLPPQDSHRQRTVNWCDQTGGTAAAFDFTTKGILQEAVQRREYWRLVDSQVRQA